MNGILIFVVSGVGVFLTLSFRFEAFKGAKSRKIFSFEPL